MFYVYILQSLVKSEKYYTGFTENIEKRIIKHNEGSVSYTSKYKPWELQTTVSFLDKKKATDFEKYLKSHS